MMRETKWMLATVAMLVLALTGCAKLQARDNLNKGVRAFRESHYENAVNYFKQAVELDPDLTTAQIYLATAYSQQYIPGGRSEENDKNAKLAIQTFESVLQRDPNNVNAIAGLASMYQSLGQTDTSQFQKALGLDPNYEDAMTYKNLLYREKARLSESEDEKKQLIAQADEWFNKALETRKKNAEKKKLPGGEASR